MSDGLIFDNSEAFCHIEKKTKPKNAKSRLQVLKILFFILLSIAFIELVLYSFVIPIFSNIQFTVTGLETLTEKEIAQYIQFSSSDTWFSFNTSHISKRLSALSQIETVSVEKKFPDRVAIHIVERKAVAFSLATIQGKTVPVQIDRKGVVFSIGKEVKHATIPLITGFALDNISEGARLHQRLLPLVEQISLIQASNPDYFMVLSEIRVLPKDYGAYDLALYPLNAQIRFLSDNVLNVESLQYIMVSLDIFQKTNTAVKEVDLRNGITSFRSL